MIRRHNVLLRTSKEISLNELTTLQVSCIVFRFSKLWSEENGWKGAGRKWSQKKKKKDFILKNLQLLQNDPKTGTIFSQPSIISLKRHKIVSNILVRGVLKSDDRPGILNAHLHDGDKILGPKHSIKITYRFTCTSTNVIYCIKYTLRKTLYIVDRRNYIHTGW